MLCLDISDKSASAYDNLLQMTPPLELQAQTLNALVQGLGWKYISVISGQEYKQLAQQFQQLSDG